MNWEPMTEEAVFERGEKLRVITKMGRMEIIVEYKGIDAFGWVMR